MVQTALDARCGGERVRAAARRAERVSDRPRRESLTGGTSRRLFDGLADVEFPARLSVSLARAIDELARRRRSAAARVPDPALGAVVARTAGVAAPPGPARPRRQLRMRHAFVIGVGMLVASGAATASSVWLAPAGNRLYGFNPGLSPSAPPASQLAALAVLRRPQTAADRGSDVQAALADVNEFTLGLRSDYVRVLARTGAGAVVLAPVERRDAASAGTTGSAAIANALCVYVPVNGVTVGETTHCWTTQQLLAGSAIAEVGGHAYGLAPDGVTAVRLSLGAWHRSAPVTDNFFDVKLPGGDGPSARLGALPVAPTVAFVRGAGA